MPLVALRQHGEQFLSSHGVQSHAVTVKPEGDVVLWLALTVCVELWQSRRVRLLFDPYASILIFHSSIIFMPVGHGFQNYYGIFVVFL